MGMMFVVQEIPVAGVNSEGEVGRGATAAVCALATSFKNDRALQTAASLCKRGANGAAQA